MSTHNAPRSPCQARWLHAWAVLTVCATLPLLLLGAEVTTTKVGMVDSQGFRPPWHMLTVSLRERGLGFVIEHAHRLAGFVVGFCTIVLAVGLWRGAVRPGYRWLGVAALAGVSLQGLLGGFRVQLNALVGPNLALVHGCFAQLVFAFLVSVALVTSRQWAVPVETNMDLEEAARLRRWSLMTAGLVYVQILFGAIVRHTDFFLGPRLHLLGAFVVLAAVVWLTWIVRDSQSQSLAAPVKLLAILVTGQLILGVESWLARFPSVEWPQLHPMTIHPELIRSVHYLVGSLIFATAVVTALRAQRETVSAMLPGTAAVVRHEEVPA